MLILPQINYDADRKIINFNVDTNSCVSLLRLGLELKEVGHGFMFFLHFTFSQIYSIERVQIPTLMVINERI